MCVSVASMGFFDRSAIPSCIMLSDTLFYPCHQAGSLLQDHQGSVMSLCRHLRVPQLRELPRRENDFRCLRNFFPSWELPKHEASPDIGITAYLSSSSLCL